MLFKAAEMLSFLSQNLTEASEEDNLTYLLSVWGSDITRELKKDILSQESQTITVPSSVHE